MKVLIYPTLILASLALLLPACNQLEKQSQAEHAEGHHHKILVTSPEQRDVVTTSQYVCQIHSCRNIEVRALEGGYLEDIHVREGQTVEKGDLLFKLIPTLYEARRDSEVAEAQLAEIEVANTQKLFDQKVVSGQELALAKAKLAKANAKVNLVTAELNFATIRAPFTGIMDRLHCQQGSLVEEGEMLTTLSDNSTMWVYFNVPEAGYLDYQRRIANGENDLKVELMLADGSKFEHEGQIAAVEGEFDNTTGTIPFRADFPNPTGLLRHGQTGTIVISRLVKDAIVIPQRATYEILAKKYVYTVEEGAPASSHDQHGVAGSEHGEALAEATEHGEAAHTEAAEHHVASHEVSHSEEHGEAHGETHGEAGESHGHGGPTGIVRQREIVILSELEDIYLVKGGIGVNEKIVLEGVQQVRDGEEVEYEYRSPEEVLKNLKYKAE